MIRTGYTTITNDEEVHQSGNKIKDGHHNTLAGKRKLQESDELAALQRLESLDLDSDDDVIVLEAEEDIILMSDDKCELPSKRKEQPNLTLTSNVKPEPGDDTASCQMKWLRTVGLNHSGVLQCTVSNALETLSDSGKTESLMADTIKGMIDVYQKKRSDIVDGNIVATPLHVVKKLADKHGETLHCDVLSFPNGLHRLELFSGNVRGIGEGTTKKIAAQMAAVDLLERVQLSGGAIKIPLVAFFPGWLTSNSVFSDLAKLCKSKDLPCPKITCKPNVTEDGLVDPKIPPFRAECWIGSDMVTVGQSENAVFARREAAKEMYNLITDNEYKDTPYAIGKCCHKASELKAAGYQMIMSDYKKTWLLQNRVANRQLAIPEEEIGFEDPSDLQDLTKDIDNVEGLGYALMKKQKIKVTLRNKKPKVDEDLESGTTNRCVSVEDQDNSDKDSTDSWQ